MRPGLVELLVVCCLLLGSSTSSLGQIHERPSSFRAVSASKSLAVDAVVNDDIPPHVIEAQRQWEARHPDSVGAGLSETEGEGVDWHHHQVEVPASLLEDLTRQHLRDVKDKVAGQLSSKAGRSHSERQRSDGDLTFVDMGNADHMATIGKLSELKPPDQFMAKRSGPGELLLWLHSAAGVDVDPMGSVLKWRDQSQHSFDFKPTIDQHVYQKQLRRGHNRRDGRGGAAQHPRWILDSDGFPTLQFPCALVNDGALILRAPLTLFAVLRPILLGNAAAGGHHAEGQRFFGTYPDGQFRFDGGNPEVFTAGEHVVRDGASNHLPPGAISILKYRVHLHKVEIAIDGRSFQEVRLPSSGTHVRHPTFSAGPVSVGGVRGKCGFDGQAYEFMLFNGTLSDHEAAEVVGYLSNKWGLHLTVSDDTSNDDSDVALVAEAPAAYAYYDGTLDSLVESGEASKSSGLSSGHGSAQSTGGQQVDLGNGASVFKWDPPDGVPKEARLAWSKAKREVLAEVAKFQQGGAALVSFLRGKDESLRKTQQQIFGGMWYVPPSVKDTEAAKIPVKAESGNKPAGNSDNSPCGSIPYPGGSLSRLAAPDCASAAMRQVWSSRYDEAMGKLRQFQAGGSALKAFIAELQVELQNAWEQAFW